MDINFKNDMSENHSLILKEMYNYDAITKVN